MTRNCVLGLTDEPLADFNMLILGPDPNADGFLTGSVARAKARGLPLTAMMSPHVARALAPVAMQFGLTAAGASPLMLLRAETPVVPGRPVKIARALGPELVGVAGDLVAAAFDVPRDAVARCIDVGITETAGVETYIAWGDDGPVSAVSVTPTGNTAGISLMATLPGRQRQGVGRALLTQVIADYRRRGVNRFHLGATKAGRPLYASLGFEPVAELSVWTLGRATVRMPKEPSVI
jgi:GNAT superfamily N-acetyltransferase